MTEGNPTHHNEEYKAVWDELDIEIWDFCHIQKATSKLLEFKEEFFSQFFEMSRKGGIPASLSFMLKPRNQCSCNLDAWTEYVFHRIFS